MYLRRVRVAGSSFAALPAHVLTVVTPLSPAAQTLGVGLWWPGRGQTLAGEDQLVKYTAEQIKYYQLSLNSGT